MGFTRTNIETETWISFASFAGSGSVLPRQKCSVLSRLSAWGLESLEQSSYLFLSLPIYMCVCVCTCVCVCVCLFPSANELFEKCFSENNALLTFCINIKQKLDSKFGPEYQRISVLTPFDGYPIFISRHIPPLSLNLSIYHHHRHRVVQLARISQTHSRHSSLSSIVAGRSSIQHPVSVLSCCRYILLDRPSLAHPREGVHRRTSLMSLSLLH